MTGGPIDTTPEGQGEHRTFADVINDALEERRITLVYTDDGGLRVAWHAGEGGPDDAA